MTLTLDRLRLRQGDFVLDACLTVPPGARVAVMGPSGAGKSTLLDLIAGFTAPVSGHVLWHGRDITADPPGARPMSVLFQDNNLFPHLTARQNVALGLRPDLKLSPAQRKEVDTALARVGLEAEAEAKPGRLSGGEQGRVALARMLLRRQPLVLLDEPFAALGPALKAEMLDLVAELAGTSGASLLMVTHDPADARRLADRTILVADGRAAPPVATEALFADPPEALRAYLG